MNKYEKKPHILVPWTMLENKSNNLKLERRTRSELIEKHKRHDLVVSIVQCHEAIYITTEDDDLKMETSCCFWGGICVNL